MTIIWFGKWWWARLGPLTFHRIYWRGHWTPFVTILWAGP